MEDVTVLTLDAACADPDVTRVVGAPLLELAQTVLRLVPDAVDPLIVSTRPWREGETHPADQPVCVMLWYHPAFYGVWTELRDREPHHAKQRASLGKLTTARLKERYWELVDHVHEFKQRSRTEEHESLREHEETQRLILEELARRGERIAG